MTTQNETKTAQLIGKQSKALDALVNYDTVEGACKAAGISKSTMYRYLKDPDFNKELKTAKRQIVNRAVLRLQQTTGDAARALAEICRDKEAPASARVTAAKAILDGALKAIELEDIESRIATLELKFSIKR